MSVDSHATEAVPEVMTSPADRKYRVDCASKAKAILVIAFPANQVWEIDLPFPTDWCQKSSQALTVRAMIADLDGAEARPGVVASLADQS